MISALAVLPFTRDYAREEFEMKFCLLLDRGGAPLVTRRSRHGRWAWENRGPCWRWLGRRSTKGYGVQWFRGVGWLLMHRVAFEVFNGELEPGLVIRHLCHTRSCCNPRHLEQGSAAENRHDRYVRFGTVRPVTLVMECVKRNDEARRGRRCPIDRQRASLALP